MRYSVIILALLACGVDKDASVGIRVEQPVVTEALSNSDRLLRISMALRGVRPSLQDYQTLEADPTQLEFIVDRWLNDPLFGETLKDMYAEALLIRADTEPILISAGPIIDVPSDQVFEAMSESSLRLLEHVVMSDQPFTNIMTADYLMANQTLSLMYGTTYDENGPEWQQAEWLDARPVAGMLSDSALWMRYPNNGFNMHRGRAAFVAKTFLCDDFNTRDINVASGIDLSDEEAVAEAVTTLPTCIGCHQALEPLSSFFWGFQIDIPRTRQNQAYNDYNCAGEYGDACYPLVFWRPEQEDDGADFGLQPPGYYGAPGDRFSDLGQFIADDPRFASCTARRFHAYLTQGALLDAPESQINLYRDALVGSEFSAKALARAVVLDPSFAVARQVDGIEGPWPSIQVIRPEQYERTLYALTGFRLRWRPGTSYHGTFEDVNLAITDRFGFRAMSGGIDGLQVTQPTHTPTPTKVLFMRYMASESAGYVVDDWVAGGADGKALFTEIPQPLSATDNQIRDQMVNFHARLLGDHILADDPEIDRTMALYQDAITRGLSENDAWKQVLSALFQDPRMMFY
ncbi:MAG: DUF1592 domain-containing protein [Rhodobacterales bacterium]|nr:DUF1592 domain-containing protein [Rhodobacterales bacterium]